MMKRQRTHRHGWVFLALTLAALLPAGAAQAGVMLFAGSIDDGTFTPDKDAKAPFYSVRYATITATVADGTARTTMVETLRLDETGVKVVGLIPLPKSALAQGAVVKIDDKAVKVRFLPAAEAEKVYRAIGKGADVVSVLALTGRPALLVDGLELSGKVKVTAEFTQRVTRRWGVCSIRCPMPTTAGTGEPASRVSLAATIRTAEPLRAVFSPTHAVTVKRHGLHAASARVKADDYRGEDDFRLCWVADGSPLGLRVIAYRDEADEDGYFMLFGNPTGGDDEKAVDKDVLFVLDVSGSMRGEKIEQARAAVQYCLGRMNPGDRFNIITFGTNVKAFRDKQVANGPENVQAAREFVEDVVARGNTNISGALAAALAEKPAPSRPRIVIFLTDGVPTAGERVPERIVQAVKNTPNPGSQIFVMGVGHDVNAHLLDKLAEATDGASEYVDPNEDIDVKVAALYDRLSSPVLANVAVAFGDLRANSVYPKKLPALFKGSEFMVFGRYRGGGEHTFTVSGTMAGKDVKYVCEVELPSEPTGLADDFVAPLWAARKIGYLLQELRLHGQNKELIEAVVALSTKYGIVTEYTEFLASAGAPVSRPEAVREATRRMAAANSVHAGQWAFQQARNDKGLQTRMVAGNAGNFFRDRRGNVVAASNIRQVGRRVFYLRDGQWMDAEEAGKRKTRVVALYSDEYFKLLKGNADFARAQKVGWNVAMNVSGERIVVEKDGKQKDESLRERSQPRTITPPAPPLRNDQGFNQRGLQLRNMQQIAPNQLRQLRQVPVVNDAKEAK